jgi:hypothetical protein
MNADSLSYFQRCAFIGKINLETGFLVIRNPVSLIGKREEGREKI